MSVVQYFTRKRNLSSTSDSNSSFVHNDRHESKRIKYTLEEEPSDMAVQQALDDINKRLESLACLATKEDLKAEVRTLTETFMKKISELEGRVFDLEARADRKDQEFTTSPSDIEVAHRAA